MGKNPLIREDRDYTLNDEFPLRKQQNDGVHFLLSKFNGVLNHQTGLGKCVPGDVRVQTDLGYKKIKDLCSFRESEKSEKLDIKVSTREGIKRTSDFYFEEDCVVKELVLSNGYRIKGTLEHKVLSQDINSNVKLIKMDDINIGDRVLMSHNKNHWSTNADNNLSKWENYLLGLYVGDGGSVEYENRTRRHYLTGRYKILSMIKEKLNLTLKISKDKRSEDNYTLGLSTRNDEHKLISNYLGNEGSADKYIPEIIFEGSRYQKLSFILGYLDADGSFSEPTLEFTSKSKVLINQLQDLLNSVGIHMYIGRREINDGKYKGNVYWRLSSIGHTLYNFSDLNNFSDSYKLKAIHRYIEDKEIINVKNPIKFNDKFIEVNSRDLMNMILPYKSDRSKYLYSLIKNGRRVVTEEMLRYLNRNGGLVECFKQFIGYSYLDVVDINYYREDVYDLTVPEGHEFMAQGLANHNTYSSLTAAQHVMNYLENTKTIIFCPKKANTSFEKELNEKIKKSYSKYETDDIVENKDADYVIYNYMSMHKYMDELADFINAHNIVAIIDEAHKLQNKDTRISKILRNFRAGFSCKFLLTATPLLNDIQGLYNIVDYIKPDFFGSYKTFEKKYLITKMKWVKRGGRRVKYKKIMGEKNIDHLSKRLKKVVQVRKKEYNLEFYYRKVKMSESMKEEYIRAAMGIIDDNYEDGDIKDFGPRLHDLQRVVDNVQEEMEKETLSNKEKLLLKTSKEILDRGEGLIVYVDYIDTEERLQELFEGYRDRLGFNKLHKITGSVGQEERNLVEQELDSKDVVIITEAGSESINLRQVNNIVFYDLPFAVGTVIQVIGRITRMDTEYDSQNVYFLEVEDTIDNYKRIMFQNNVSLIKELFGGNSNLPSKVEKVDKRLMKYVRKKLLWKFEEWKK